MYVVGTKKAAAYLQNTLNDNDCSVAFVSTNSITQGEQVSVLWNDLLLKDKIIINFAHRTFSWSNEARSNAAVHVVIIGFSLFNKTIKYIFDYESLKSEPNLSSVKKINPYLIEAENIFVKKRRTTICNVPEMIKGSMPNDGGNFLFTTIEKEMFLRKEVEAFKYFRCFIGGYEFLNKVDRWCLWLKDIDPSKLNLMPLVKYQVEKVKQIRLESNRPTTQKDANTPTLFGEDRQPQMDYLALAEVSSENRPYLPIDFVSKNTIASNKIYMIPGASMYIFGVLSSKMQIVWVKNVAGRMKSDYSYSTGIVYNNFPWPENPTPKQIEAVETAAQAVLDARKQFPESSLADLYDPLTMPPVLVKAHQALDKAVDLCYRSQPFPNETKRIEYLFELYEKYTGGLFGGNTKK